MNINIVAILQLSVQLGLHCTVYQITVVLHYYGLALI